MTATYHAPYHLFARPLKGGFVWYYRPYDQHGRRLPQRSTGIRFASERDRARTRRAAKASLDEMHARGKLLGSMTATTLDDWVKRHAFWDWKRSTYVRGIIARSEKARPGITENYISDGAGVYEKRIKPYHGTRFLDEITPADCEEILFIWTADVTHKTANNYRSYYSTMLAEAARLGDIQANPWDRVQQLKAEPEKRGGFTIAEGARIISADGLDLSDARERTYHLAIKTAFLAGLRVGEVCGLVTDDLRTKTIYRGDDAITMYYLDIRMQYHQKLRRRVPVKDKDARAVPITPELATDLGLLMTGQGRYLFSLHPRHEHPLTQQRVREWVYRRMDAVGISAGEREARNLTLHSARRFFNTLLRRSVSDDVLRKMTGHDSSEMSEHYTDYLPEDLLAITEAQGRLADHGR